MAIIFYDDIYNDLKKGIKNKVFPAGSKLPSEKNLCEKYNVSRNTVRRAFKILSDEGAVTSVKGKGVFVLNQKQINFIFGGVKSFAEITTLNNLKYTTEVKEIKEIIVDKKLADETNFQEGTKVLNILRLRQVDKETIIIDNNYFDSDIINGLTKKIAQGSIYEYIEKQLDLKIFGAQKMITVEESNSQDRDYLLLNNLNCVAVVKRSTFLENGKQFEFTESRHHPEKFIFTTFAKRSEN